MHKREELQRERAAVSLVVAIIFSEARRKEGWPVRASKLVVVMERRAGSRRDSRR